MNDKLSFIDYNRKELLKEFNQNYRNYLENTFLFNLIIDLIVRPQNNTNNSSSTSSIDKFDPTANLTVEEKIRETFLKSYYLFKNSDKTNDLVEDIKIDMLNIESKQLIVDKIETKLDNVIQTIDEYLTISNQQSSADQEMSVVKWNLNEQTIENSLFNDDSFDSMNKKVDQDQILEKFKNLLDLINNKEIESNNLYNETLIKFEHCLNISIEVLNTLKTILNDFKLKFYAQKLQTDCNRALLSCDLLLGKINLVVNQLTFETYSPDKIKALNIIKTHINMETSLVKEKLDNVEQSLNMFKSFGKELDSILKTYLELKSQYESKEWTLNKLKEESNYF